MRGVIFGSLVLMLAGCATYQLPAPQEFEAGEPLRVNGRQGWAKKAISFGEYEARDINRGWVRGRGWEIAGFKSHKNAQPFNYILASSGTPVWFVECAFFTDDKSIGMAKGVEIEFKDKSQLQCAISPAAADAATAPLRLELNSDDDNKPMAGSLSGAHTLEVQGIGMVRDGKRGPTGGFYLRQDGRPVATVEVANSGRVILARDAAPATRDLSAAVAAALLLIDESLRDQS